MTDRAFTKEELAFLESFNPPKFRFPEVPGYPKPCPKCKEGVILHPIANCSMNGCTPSWDN
jgi:hypothetical protein